MTGEGYVATGGSDSTSSPTPLLLVVGSALVGALLAGGVKLGPDTTTPAVVLVQADASAATVTKAATESAEAASPTPTPVPVPAPRLPGFDRATDAGMTLFGFGLLAVVAVGLAAIAVAVSRRGQADEEVLFDNRPETLTRLGIAALILTFVGLGTVVLTPTIEAALDADHVRYLPTPSGLLTPSVVPSGSPAPSSSVAPSSTPSASASVVPSSSPEASASPVASPS